MTNEKKKMTFEEARHYIEDGYITKMTPVDMETLCAYFQCTPKTLRRRVVRGELPPSHKEGRRNIWSLSEIRSMLQSKMKQTRFKRTA